MRENQLKKYILVTGCSSGIGLDIAHTLRNSEFHVVASCRKPEDCRRLKAMGISTLQLDLADSESIADAVNELLALCHGQLYGLINNAAYGQPGAVEDLSRRALREQFETNVFGTQELTNALLPVMRKAKHGRVIQISSVLGFICLPYRGAYNASKYALEALTDTLRLELRGTRIQASLIEPGPITSRFRANALARFNEHIDIAASAHQSAYQALLKRLATDQPVAHTLGPEAVTAAVLHALRSRNPKIRYRITRPTHMAAPLKRLLPDRWMDKFLSRQ